MFTVQDFRVVVQEREREGVACGKDNNIHGLLGTILKDGGCRGELFDVCLDHHFPGNDAIWQVITEDRLMAEKSA